VGTLIESITKAIEKGKIKARRVDDLTSAEVEIQIHLMPGVSSDKTLDALYAFTDCEINISPNCCVIADQKPQFLTISDVLRHSVERTKDLIRQELEIRRGELMEQLHFQSLEKIFIEERIYKDREFEQAPNIDKVCEHIDERLTPYYPTLVREVTKDDILRLLEIKMQRILKFSKDKADELMARIKAEIEEIDRDLQNLVEVTADWFQFLKDKYGKEHPRLTEIRNFDTIEATKVAEANQKLYINRNDGFIGTGLKKDEYVCNCSDIDDIIIFYKDGKYKVIRVAEKIFVGKNVLHLQVFKKNDSRTIYNAVYRDGKKGPCYIKRFNVTSMTRDKEYDLTQGTPGSKVMYFTANPNGEAEVIKVTLDPNPKVKKIFFDKDFSDIIIKGRSSKGNLLTKYSVHRIGLKSHGHSTLGGRKVWYDPDVNRLNYDDHGQLLGEFYDEDQILVVLQNGDFYLTNFDLNNHFEENILRIEKFKPSKVWTAILYDADNQGYPYLKRFLMDATKRKQNWLSDNPASKLILLTDTAYPRILVTYGGVDEFRGSEEIDAEQFIAVKGFKAKGKRISTWQLASVEELEPTRFPEEPETPDNADEADEPEENLDPDAGKSEQQLIDEMTGQLRLFDDE
jgi:topoisomerase-4 subunit A